MSNRPALGEIMYLAPNKKGPVKIMHVNDHLAIYVPEETLVRTTHKGNLYNADGERPYMD